MADEVAIANEKLSEDDIRSFLDAKKVKIACELCEATAWLIYPHTKSEPLDVALMICGNCGNIRRHLSATIRRWKSKGY